jgi:hypothetical protein
MATSSARGTYGLPRVGILIGYHNPKSRFHRSLYINYPNNKDRREGRKGDWIMIHGLGPEFRWAGRNHTATNWTDGCIAVTDEEIEEIYSSVLDSTPVLIFDPSVLPGQGGGPVQGGGGHGDAWLSDDDLMNELF